MFEAFEIKIGKYKQAIILNYAILTGEYPLFSFFRTVLTGRSHHVVEKSLSQPNEANEQEIAERISRYINAATKACCSLLYIFHSAVHRQPHH